MYPGGYGIPGSTPGLPTPAMANTRIRHTVRKLSPGAWRPAAKPLKINPLCSRENFPGTFPIMYCSRS